MLRYRLSNKFLKTKTEESKQLYNKQRNLCVTLLHKAKINYIADLDNRISNNNTKFWKTVNPIFSERTHYNNYNQKRKMAEAFNSFFSSMVDNLKIAYSQKSKRFGSCRPCH